MNFKKTSHYLVCPTPAAEIFENVQKRELITCDCTHQFWGIQGESTDFESNILLIAEDNMLRTREYANEIRLFASERQLRARVHILLQTMTQLENFQYVRSAGVKSVIFDISDIMDSQRKLDERRARLEVAKVATDFEANQFARIVIDVQETSEFWQKFEIPRVAEYEDLLLPGVVDELNTRFWVE